MSASNMYWFWLGVACCFLIICVLFYINTNNHKWETFMSSRVISIINDHEGVINNITKHLDNIEIMLDGEKKYLSVLQRKDNASFKTLGQYLYIDNEKINLDELRLFNGDSSPLTLMIKGGVNAIGFIHLWDSRSLPNNKNKFSVWKVVAPEGYRALSDIITSGYDEPPLDIIYCVPNHFLEKSEYGETIFSIFSGTENFIKCKSIGKTGFFSCSTYNIHEGETLLQLKEDSIIYSGDYNTNDTVHRVKLFN